MRRLCVLTSDATECEEALEGGKEGEWSLQRRMKEGTKWRLLLKVAIALLCCFSRFATFKMALWDTYKASQLRAS